MKLHNPARGCPRIAPQITLAFDIPIDKDVVRTILARHYRPEKDSGSPSWLTFPGHANYSLRSINLLSCESATLRTHWVLAVTDQVARPIIGFGVWAGTVDGVALRRMPKHLSSDHDPLYRFAQWQANLGTLQVTRIKTVPSWNARSARFDANAWIAR